jgi:hypothetical protein
MIRFSRFQRGDCPGPIELETEGARVDFIMGINYSQKKLKYQERKDPLWQDC